MIANTNRIKNAIAFFIFLFIQFNTSAQFFCRIKGESGYWITVRHAHGKSLQELRFELKQTAGLTNSELSFEYTDLRTYTNRLKAVTIVEGEGRDVERSVTKDTACTHFKAEFKGGIDATYEAWFDFLHSSRAIRIKFRSRPQYEKQIQEIKDFKHYDELSPDTLVLNKGAFWNKYTRKKMFGKEIMTLDDENMEINVVAKYFRRKEFKALNQRLAEANEVKAYQAHFYPDSVKVHGVLVPADTTKFSIDANGVSRLVLWENDDNKVSVLYKVKTVDDKLVTRSREEIFKNGRWKNAKFRIRLIERMFLRVGRWGGKGVSYLGPKCLSMSTGFPVKKVFEGDNGETIEVYGYFKTQWK